MVDTCVAPSELHLKKELTALQKARFLRDPRTCSSWRSPMSCKSFTASCKLNHRNGTPENSGEKDTGKMLGMPSTGKIRKKVYLYNWRDHSSKSSDNNKILDEDDKDLSVEERQEDNFNNPHNMDSRSDNCLEAPLNMYNIRGTNQATVKKLRNAISKKEMTNHSTDKKVLDPLSTSLGFLNSFEPSEDTEHCNSEDLLQLTRVLTSKIGYQSPSVSPLHSGSGCGNWSYSSKILRSTRKQGSSQSCTPASTSSYYKYGGHKTSIVESCDGTTTSFDGDEYGHLDLPRNNGCGIPCYWRKKTKDRSRGDFYSPSLSDTLKKKGSGLFCGSQTSYNKKRSAGSHKQKHLSKSSQGLPLLSNSCDEGNSSLDTASDELSANYGEVELEAVSRLDGRRWSSCKSYEGLQSVRSTQLDMNTTDHKSLSQKYSPRSFDDIIGQNIVVHSLRNAILRGRIAPAYLFQGPRGTGKTLTARIFAAALNCLSTEDNKPCGICRECTSIFSGNGSNVREVDAINKTGIDGVRYLLKNISVAKAVSRYKVFIIDECHMLSSRMWSAFMNFLQEPPPHLVFIFITIDPDSLPRAIMSHCQKYLFTKVKDVDIVCRLRKLSYEENLDIELDALDLIALNSDGSLQDAETMLEQLSLLGKRITTSLVNDLVGVVSDEKLLDLLEIAMSSDTAETVKRSRELMDSGVDPMALMSQLAALIMDIIAGTNQLADSQCVSEDELKRLQKALKILSDAEKQLRVSSERSTWFTAALLQLGSNHNTDFTQSSNSSEHSIGVNDGAQKLAKDSSFTVRGSSSAQVSRAGSDYSSLQSCPPSYKVPRNGNLTSDILPSSTHVIYRPLDDNGADDINSKKSIMCISPSKLALIWKRCIQRCNSETLRQLLNIHGKLLSIAETENTLIACIVFDDENAKSIAQRYLSSISNSIQIVLQDNVEVRIGLLSKNHKERTQSMPDSPSNNKTGKHGQLVKESNVDTCSSKVSCDHNYKKKPNPNLPRKFEQSDLSLVQYASGEHGLEHAWLEDADKNQLEVASRSNPNTKQVLPQNGVCFENHKMSSTLLASKQWEDQLNHESKALESTDNQGYHKKQIGSLIDRDVIVPSLLHSNGLAANSDKENKGYESGPGCSGLFCWQPRKSFKAEVKKGFNGQSRKTRRLHCLGSLRSRKHEPK